MTTIKILVTRYLPWMILCGYLCINQYQAIKQTQKFEDIAENTETEITNLKLLNVSLTNQAEMFEIKNSELGSQLEIQIKALSEAQASIDVSKSRLKESTTLMSDMNYTIDTIKAAQAKIESIQIQLVEFRKEFLARTEDRFFKSDFHEVLKLNPELKSPEYLSLPEKL